MQKQIVHSIESKKVLALARNKHWKFRSHGQNGMIDTPTFESDWLYIPVDQDKSIIPNRAFKRVQVIKDAGFVPRQIIVAHEASKLLTAPQKLPKNVEFPSEQVETAFTSAVNVLLILGRALGYVLLMSVLAVDPALIVVLPDGTWMEVMRWYD